MKLVLTTLSKATRPRACYSCRCQSKWRLRSFSSNSGSKPLIVLGIESSADDSSCSIVTSNRQILGLSTISQHTQNSEYGGIHPLVAQKSHAQNIPKVIEMAISQAKSKFKSKLDTKRFGIEDVDAIAYTRGPGMKGCLSIGEMAAKGLAAGLGKKLFGIHHMQAHAMTPLLTEETPPKYPFLILLVSGGHTQLVLASGQEQFKILLDTLDSKIGDVFEKAARLLRLPPHPTKSPGAILEQYASSPSTVPVPTLPIPLSMNDAVHTRAFSFAGILSSLQRELSLLPPYPFPDGDRGLKEEYQKSYSKAFQESVIKHLTFKLSQTIDDLHLDPEIKGKIDGLVVSGGVASNLYLRDQLQLMISKSNLGGGKVYYPPVHLCTDNAAMIAWAAILRLQSSPLDYTDSYDLPLRPKWSLEDLYDDL